MINGHNYQTMRDNRIVESWQADIREAIPGISDASCQSLAMYLALGVKPGGFMRAMLACDIKDALLRADPTNADLIPDYICYWLVLPDRCWGSYEAVDAWQGGIALEAF